MISDTEKWLKSGKYLPKPLRNFHDQKEVFKAIHQIIKDDHTSNRPDWVTGQIYVIDVFLWFMAMRGYTLQRTRRKGEYRDLADDVRAANEQRNAVPVLGQHYLDISKYIK